MNRIVHSTVSNYLLGLFALIVLAGCSEPKASAPPLRTKSSNECQNAVVAGSYLAKWNNGEITTEHGGTPEEFINDFGRKHSDELEYVEPDYRVTLPKPTPDEHPIELISASFKADNWGPINIQADTFWREGAYGQGVIVAVIDSGVDINHLQLKNQIALNPGEDGLDSKGNSKHTNGIDDDKNGYVDDYAGFDFILNTGAVIHDYGYHGTHVSGIIAAEHQDTVAAAADYVQGLAPEASILPLAFIDESGGGNISDALRAIDYAVMRGARIINASWGSEACSQALQDKIASLTAKDISFIAAAGNGQPGVNIDQRPMFPAAFQNPIQITVGSIDSSNEMATHSNYGDKSVHLFAPGSKITSTVPFQGLATLNGTSMATPFASAALALMLSDRPKARGTQARQILLQTVSVQANYRNATRGRLNLANTLSALRAAVGP